MVCERFVGDRCPYYFGRKECLGLPKLGGSVLITGLISYPLILAAIAMTAELRGWI